jgi:cysteine-rich repeat protein
MTAILFPRTDARLTALSKLGLRAHRPAVAYSNGCRNGTREMKEGCDDGNNIAGDGCDTKCEVEHAWQCADTPHGSIPHAVVSNCVVSCGDGVRLDGKEGCDDRNEEDGDGCSSSGVVEVNSSCVDLLLAPRRVRRVATAS